MDPSNVEMLPDNTETTSADLGAGMIVVDSAGEHVGTIKDVRDADFLVDRQFQRDVYIPFAAVDRVMFAGDRFHHDTHVVLRVRREDIDARHWAHPSL
jgi:hypothetical protein